MSNEAPELPPEGVNPQMEIIKFVIEFAPQTGQMNVRAPQDPILCYGMLEIAKQIIQQRSSGEISKSGILRV